jgi:hypothetical protein
MALLSSPSRILGITHSLSRGRQGQQDRERVQHEDEQCRYQTHYGFRVFEPNSLARYSAGPASAVTRARCVLS